MTSTDKGLSPEERSILRDMVGRELLTVDAVIVARGDLSWNTVRLHLDGAAVDVDNRLADIVVDELGTIEEFGLLSVRRSSLETLALPDVGADTTTRPVGRVVTGVSVLADEVTIHGGGTPVASLSYPQAILVGLGDERLVLDKETWFSEMIAVKAGPDPLALAYDGAADWEDDPDEDPTTHYEFSSHVEEL